jgi:VanZ family protein
MKKNLGIAAFVSYAALVAFVSLQPASGVSIGHYDKLGHFLAYATFAFLARGISRSRQYFTYVCCAIVVYGALMEFGQSLVPGRDMSALDFLANTMGVVVGALLCMKLVTDGKSPVKQ